MSETEKPISSVVTPPLSKQKQQRGLGRGLANLLSSTIAIQDSGLKIQWVPIEKLEPHEKQPRQIFDEKELTELSQSILEHGILQPIVVFEDKEKGVFKIVAGERRFRAAKIAKLEKLPAIVRDELDDPTRFELALIENIQRSSLSPLEEAKAYHVLLEEYQVSQEELSQRVGKERSSISNTLRLLKLHPEVIQLLEEKKISVGHAKIICGQPFEKQPSLLKTILKKMLSVRALEAYLKPSSGDDGIELTKVQHKIPKIELDPQFEKMRSAVEELLSMKVSLVPRNKESGEIRFRYHSLQALTELFEMLTVK